MESTYEKDERNSVISLEEWMSYTNRALEGLEGEDIWNVMTAMRGPDMYSEDIDKDTLKDLTTARIRFAVFGLTPRYNSDVGAIVNDDRDYQNAFEITSKHQGHFYNHIRRALRHLNDHGIINIDVPKKENHTYS